MKTKRKARKVARKEKGLSFRKRPVREKTNDGLRSELLAALEVENKERVIDLMDRLNRRGAHEGIAMDAARKFLNQLEGERG